MQKISTLIELPSFNQVNVQEIEAKLEKILNDNKQRLKELLAQSQFTWENLILPFNEMQNELQKFWSPISHLHSVKDSEELRPIYNKCLEKLSDYFTELGQNEIFCAAIKHITDNKSYFQHLDYAQHKVIENHLRDFKLSGVDLPNDDKKRFAELEKRYSQLATKFEENVLDATQSWNYHTTDSEELKGLPEHALQLAAQEAQAKQLSGWLFTLTAPSYSAIVTYADNRKLREQFYQAYVTRASDQGPDAGKFDNSGVMQELLDIRLKLAKMLGFNSFAEYSLAKKMAEQPTQVIDFLQELAVRSKPVAEQELMELKKFAADHYAIDDLQPWDISYLSEKLCQIKHAVSQEELRPYFTVNKVLTGLFQLVEKLYAIKIREINIDDKWHPDVQFFEIYDQQDEIRGGFYTDLYSRQHKRGGAWMDEYCGRFLNQQQQLQIPIAYLTCNFSAPVGDKPALLTHDEVLTLFHEFGHGLQHLLTKVNYLEVAGISGVPWDAVELASQFMEFWCWEQEVLQSISEHYITKEVLPSDILHKLLAAKNFQTGLQMLRQIEFALFDFRLHQEYGTNHFKSVQNLLNEIRKEVRITPVWPKDRMAHGFSHIFGGSYAAGYYSYKWAEVLASDAFSRFEEEGLFNPQVSFAFLQTILEQGGSRDAMDLFVEFRGRKPSTEALLRHSGMESFGA